MYILSERVDNAYNFVILISGALHEDASLVATDLQMTTKSSQTDGAPSANKYKILKAAANEDQSLKTRMDRYKQLSNLHMVLTFIDHHNAYPRRHHSNCNSRSPDFGTNGCSVAHFHRPMSSRDNTLKIDSNYSSGNFAVKGREEHLRCQHFLSCQFHPFQSQVQQLCFQMRRDCSEHLQQESYMLAVGLDAVEMVVVPLHGAQSHSAQRRESIKDLGHMEHFYLLMRSQGRHSFNANRQRLYHLI